MTSALVIGRRRKGRPIEATVDATRAGLEAAGWTVESQVVGRKRDLQAQALAAVEASVDVVVAVGGDGAVLRVVQAVVGTTTALGIVPTGTGNLVATNVGLPSGVDSAIETLLAGHRRTIDVGEVRLGKGRAKRTAGKLGKGRWRFAVACGIGLDAEVMGATKRKAKLRWGKLAYLASLVSESGRSRSVRHTMTIDGRPTTVDATEVIVANFGRTGLRVEPKLPILPDDGLLDVLVMRGPGRTRGLLAAWSMLRQGHLGPSRSGRSLRARARTVRIATKPRRPVEVDGTVIGRTPIEVTVHPAALTIIASPEDAA